MDESRGRGHGGGGGGGGGGRGPTVNEGKTRKVVVW